jgi:hypothetical protein
MPCYNGRDDGKVRIVNNDIHHYLPTPEQQMRIAEIENQNKHYAAMLCALTKDLKSRGILHEVLSTASTDGKYDFNAFILEHNKEDEERLKRVLFDFSKHERETLLEILRHEFGY